MGEAVTWTGITSLNEQRYTHTATRLDDGRVLVAGGVGPLRLVTSAELYAPATSTWTPCTMQVARILHTATKLTDGKVLVVGGDTPSGLGGDLLARAEIFNPTTGSWTTTGSMAQAREFHTAVLLKDGRVLVVGGMNASGYLTSAEIYNPANEEWTSTKNMIAKVGAFLRRHCWSAARC